MELREMGSKLQISLRNGVYNNVQYAIPQDVSHKRADNLHNHESHRPATAIPTIQDSAHEVSHKDAAVNSI